MWWVRVAVPVPQVASIECVTKFSRRTLVGPQDARTLVYNIKYQRPVRSVRSHASRSHY